MPTVYEPKGRTARELAIDIEAAITAGIVGPDDLLPPIRAVAARNGVAAATVGAAYRVLRQRGLVVGERRRGTRVARTSAPTRTRTGILPPGVIDLSSGNPDPALLPDLRPYLRQADQPSGSYQEAVNVPALLEVAGRRFADEGVPTSSLTVTHGAMDAIERILRLHLRSGDGLAVEDPGYSSVFDVARALNLRLVPVAVDEAGIIPDALRDALDRHRPKAVVLTPRAHNPTGAAWDERRRRELRRVFTRHTDLLVIEDDHAGPVAGVPYAPLALRSGRQWAVVRSVSKSLSPDLRLAVVVGSDRLIDRLESDFGVGPGWVSHLIQSLVATLYRDPQIDALLETAAGVYEQRRQALLLALRARGLSCSGRSGLNIWVDVASEERAVTGLLAAGWAVAAGERFRLASPPCVRITTAQLDPRHAGRLADAIADLLGDPRHTRPA